MGRRLPSAVPILAVSLCAALSSAVPVQADTLAEAMARVATDLTSRAARRSSLCADEQVSQALSFSPPASRAAAGGGHQGPVQPREHNDYLTSSTTDGPTIVLNLQAKQPIDSSMPPRVRQAEEQVSVRARSPRRHRAGCPVARRDGLSGPGPRRSFSARQHRLRRRSAKAWS